MRIIKELSLLLAGALIGISAVPFESQISKYLLIAIVLIVLLILIGAGLLGWLGTLFLRGWLFTNRRKRKISLFAPHEIDSDTSSWVSVSLQQILNELKKSRVKFTKIIKDKDFKKYPMVINPYGGVYPEDDLSTLKSLDNIFDYVRNGGIYVNIADIPFYYAYERNLKRRIDTTPLAGDFLQVRSFLQTILTRKLHCFVFGLTAGKDFDTGIWRVIELTDNTNNFFHKEIVISEDGKKYSPFLAIPYGRGYFVFSTLMINKENIGHISEIIKKSLELLV